MTTPDPKARAIALDALQQALGLNAADAEEAFRNAQHLVHVRMLLKYEPVGTAAYEFGEWEATCRDCGENVVDDSRSSAHAARCAVAAAWRALGDPRGTVDIERAHDEAHREAKRREDRRRELAARARPDFYGPRDPRWQREYLGQFPIDYVPASDAVDAHTYALRSAYGISQVIIDEMSDTPSFERITARSTLPPIAWRGFADPGTMFTREGNFTAARRVSDARGMGVVADDALREHLLRRTRPEEFLALAR